ncbi:dGTP triphosphohydrolase [Undibacterium sp. TC4M20W]|uniref:dGTP triphosphohydrolase n=1 Tax=Undibacterium sp. TC4M20W TaxID=3413052 RepID=UPI003BF42F60
MNANTNQWDILLNTTRRKNQAEGKPRTPVPSEARTEIERDYDRILFSTPVRRLADKTQVFPLDKNDSVRTRLTHSHEVSNLARSIGTTLAFDKEIAGNQKHFFRNIPSLLASIGLVHDLGNPPFGHQGEAAIQSWFKDNENAVLNRDSDGLSLQQKLDFLKFEGNAQGFRLVTRLQLLNDSYGLNLTYATLSAMMKYPISSDKTDSDGAAACKKHGFFYSEQSIAEEVQKSTGLEIGKRHPLAYVMEACDDIAYVVLDAEDAIKKGLASFSDLISYLKHHANGDEIVLSVTSDSLDRHGKFREQQPNLSPSELNDVSMQLFRVYSISKMIQGATTAFIENKDTFINGSQTKTLMKMSNGETLRKLLKDFSIKHAYNHRTVLELELEGYNVIRLLMDIFWLAISDIEDPSKPSSKRRHPFTRYVYGRISENYRRIYEDTTTVTSDRYRECLLLTDMISGMTDSFALNLCKELSPLYRQFKLDRTDPR